jgi:NAD(P)H-dependent nitrite reductase small subunit
MSQKILGSKSDIPDGQGKLYEVGDESIAVFRVGEKIFAIEDFCKHRGGSLSQGHLQGELVECPMHGWVYDISSGECLTDPKGKVKSYEVILDCEKIIIELPSDLNH